MKLHPSEVHKILTYILTEGCILLEDDVNGTHPELEMPNLKVRKIVNSCVGKGDLKKVFVWRHGYYTLTNEGIENLKVRLARGDSFMPITHSVEGIKENMAEAEIVDKLEE